MARRPKSWWKNGRSLLAARIRSARRRMRASFRAAVRQQMQIELMKASARVANRVNQLRELEEDAERAIALVASITAKPLQIHPMAKTLRLEITLSDAMLLQARDPDMLLTALAQQIGNSARREMLKVSAQMLKDDAIARRGWKTPQPTKIKGWEGPDGASSHV